MKHAGLHRQFDEDALRASFSDAIPCAQVVTDTLPILDKDAPIPPPPEPEPVDPPLMILSILKELTRPPPPPLLCLGGEAHAAADELAGLPAPPPSLLLPRLSVLSLCLLRLGDPLSNSRNIDLFLGEIKCPAGPSRTSRGWCGTGLVGRRGAMSAGEVR